MTKAKVVQKPKSDSEATATTEARDSAPIQIDGPWDDGVKTPAPDLRPPEDRGQNG